jgi:hypothetical protein
MSYDMLKDVQALCLCWHGIAQISFKNSNASCFDKKISCAITSYRSQYKGYCVSVCMSKGTHMWQSVGLSHMHACEISCRNVHMLFDLVITSFLHDFAMHDKKSCGNLSVCKQSSFRKDQNLCLVPPIGKQKPFTMECFEGMKYRRTSYVDASNAARNESIFCMYTLFHLFLPKCVLP